MTSHFEAGSSIGTASSGRSCKGSSWPSFLLLTMFCFFHTGLAGVADDFDRPRNVLPLPDLSGDAGGGVRAQSSGNLSLTRGSKHSMNFLGVSVFNSFPKRNPPARNAGC